MTGQDSPPNLRLRILIFSYESGRRREAKSVGEVGMEFRPFVNSWANRTEKSFSLDSPMPTCARDFSRTLDAPKRRLKNAFP